MKRKIAVLGATGSIGRTALESIRRYEDRLEVVLLANGSAKQSLLALDKEFCPEYSFCQGERLLLKNGKEIPFDENFLTRSETFAGIDIVINGIDGIAGLKPTLAALEARCCLATANKESFVSAGSIINSVKKQNNAKIIPLDSEHSAAWQCIGNDTKYVDEIILTASGGAFRNYTKEQLSRAKAVYALRHPNWVMGKKVTIDCATLMNKGMEIIEAKHLFDAKKISVVQHDESIIHSMVRFSDGTVMANMSNPDMTLPIQYALSYPERWESKVKMLDFSLLTSLNFGKIDRKSFPCLEIAEEVALLGDVAGCVMNAANEVLVKAYLEDVIGFYDIPTNIEYALRKFASKGNFENIEDVFCMDKEVREYTLKSIGWRR